MRVTVNPRACAAALILALAALAVACSAAPVSTAPSAAPAQPAQSASTGAPEGTAVVAGDVQTISVDLSQGFYDPTVIRAKAGLPLEITFGEGRGCLASVLIPAFGIDQDLRSGGAVVKLPAMQAGEYEFSCGMEMVFGSIVVQ